MGLSDASIDHVSLIDQDSYMTFDNSWEAATWFNKYTDYKTLMVFYNWQNREIVLLVDRNKATQRRILGFSEVLP
jgi:hypothetical protein